MYGFFLSLFKNSHKSILANDTNYNGYCILDGTIIVVISRKAFCDFVTDSKRHFACFIISFFQIFSPPKKIIIEKYRKSTSKTLNYLVGLFRNNATFPNVHGGEVNLRQNRMASRPMYIAAKSAECFLFSISVGTNVLNWSIDGKSAIRSKQR